MIRYILLRTVQIIPTVLLVTIVVFVLVMVIPGDPVLSMLGYYGDDATTAVPKEIYDRMFRELRLDRPLPIQYLFWLGDALQGDFGKSVVFRVPVIDVVLSRVPATIYLGTFAVVIAIAIAVPFGVWAAMRNNTWVDHLASGFVLFGISVPGFWFGMIAILAFSIYLDWLPAIGYVAPQDDFPEFVKHLILPAGVLGLDVAATILRFQRTDFLEQLHQDYVRMARAKGLPRRIVIWKHVLKNSLMATVTVVGLNTARLLGGSTIIETLFSYPGLSRLLIEAIYARDFPIIQAVVLLMVMLVVVINFCVDLVYAYLNPRIRYATA
jgi:peptide/nickel transport system permease protein